MHCAAIPAIFIAIGNCFITKLISKKTVAQIVWFFDKFSESGRGFLFEIQTSLAICVAFELPKRTFIPVSTFVCKVIANPWTLSSIFNSTLVTKIG